LFEHEYDVDDFDFTLAFLCLQAVEKVMIILEAHVFERMTQVAITGAIIAFDL
jgi:hypothetical protein